MFGIETRKTKLDQLTKLLFGSIDENLLAAIIVMFQKNVPLAHRIIFVIAFLAVVSGQLSSAWSLAIGIACGLTLGTVLGDKNAKYGKQILQYSVIGLGFGMQLMSVVVASKQGFVLTTISICATIVLGTLIGRALLVEKQTTTLISSGTAICGGSAIAAVGSAIKANAQSMTVALCCVFVLNAVALFVFPHVGNWLQLTQQQFGLWAAIAIHDTSSVVGAASIYGNEALTIATTVKLARALWIIPLALLYAYFSRSSDSKVSYPWFILWFLGAVVLNTLLPQFEVAFGYLHQLAKLGLKVALFFIGSSMTIEILRRVGLKPMLLALLLWLFISVASLAAIYYQILI